MCTVRHACLQSTAHALAFQCGCSTKWKPEPASQLGSHRPEPASLLHNYSWVVTDTAKKRCSTRTRGAAAARQPRQSSRACAALTFGRHSRADIKHDGSRCAVNLSEHSVAAQKRIRASGSAAAALPDAFATLTCLLAGASRCLGERQKCDLAAPSAAPARFR